MRVGHRYVLVTHDQRVRTTIAQDASQHVEDNQYATAADSQCTSRDAFLRSPLFAPWVRELHDCYRRALGDAGRILSIGSGLGEHDVLLHMAGYRITATDLISDLGRTAQQWFPDLPYAALNALNPDELSHMQADCVLASGLDYALDNAQLDALFANVATVLARSTHAQRRFVFTVRYRDNALTRVVDNVLLPLEGRIRLWRSGPGHRIVRRAHGYRRKPAEVVSIAGRHNFEHRATLYAGAGVEFDRSRILGHMPFLPFMRTIDRKLHVASNCVVLVFDLND